MNKLVNLQILRGIAASFVVVDHAMEALISRGLLDAKWSELAWFFGWLGVVVFFAISGFIMVRSTPSGSEAGTVAGFLARRLIRVVPLYWIAAGLYLLLKLLIGKQFDLGALLKSLAFIPYLEPGTRDMRPIIGQGWTLNYEMFFYAIFALCLIPRPKLGRFALFACLFGLVVCHTQLVDSPIYDTPKTVLQFWTDPILLFFAGGAAIGYLERSGYLRATVICRCVFQRPLLTSCILLGLDVTAFAVSGFVFSLPYSAQFMFGIVPVVVTLICTADCTRSESRVASLLSRAGDASYSTYLFHPLAIVPIIAVYGRLPVGMQAPIVFILAALMASTIVGTTIFATAEKRSTVILRRILSASPLERWVHLSRKTD